MEPLNFYTNVLPLRKIQCATLNHRSNPYTHHTSHTPTHTHNLSADPPMVNWVMSDVGETSLNTFSVSCLIPSFPPHVSFYRVLFGSFPWARETKTFANANFGSRKSSFIVLDMVSVGYDDISPCCGSMLANFQHSGCCDTRSHRIKKQVNSLSG